MGTNTDLNIQPYFDDYEDDKNFHRILFKPSVAVQARELTQLQTILQTQVERMGDNVFQDGTIIKGANFTEISDIKYVKLRDQNVSGQILDMSRFEGKTARGSVTGIEANITLVSTGYETQAPNLNTLFVKYITTADNGAKVFGDNENIEIIDNGVVIDTVTVAGNTANPTGDAYAVHVGDGIIFRKGFFVRVEPQTAIVSKYTNYPDQIAIGFDTVETIVNSYDDDSLLDNASGFNNENAPGGDRLKLEARLIAKTEDEANADEDFFTIQLYRDGAVVRRNAKTQYDELLKLLMQRTNEESGDYVVNPFPIRVETNTANTQLLDVVVDAGIGYIDGRRVELLDSLAIPSNKSFDSSQENSQSIATNYGHYILVNEMAGDFYPGSIQEYDLYDTDQNAVSGSTAVPTSPTGTKIGTCKIKAVALDSKRDTTANNRYRLYAFDVKIAPGQTFGSVRSIYKAPSGGVGASADLVYYNIQEQNFNKSLFSTGREAIKSIPANSTVSDYTQRIHVSDLTLSGASGVVSVVLSGDKEWPFSGVLNSTQKSKIVMIPQANMAPYQRGIPVDLTSATVNVSGNTMTITAPPTSTTNNVNMSVHVDVKRNVSNPAGKLLETVFVRIDPNTQTNTQKMSLGLPDVKEIEGIWIGANTYAESATNSKDLFKFDDGQRDTAYELASIGVTGSSPTLGPDAKILVKAKVFRKDITGDKSDGIFTVNSYPINDTDPSDVNSITTEEIPRYISEDGVKFDLRDCVDMRPMATPTAAYSDTIAGSTENPSGDMSFSGNAHPPTPNGYFETDYEYYLARTDLLVIDTLGQFAIIEGIPGENPAPPPPPSDGMVIATLNIPPYPSLPKTRAEEIGRAEMGVSIILSQNKRYTMKDISQLDARIRNIEYYTALNALEVKTNDMLITDANGQNRFKNGIFVDPFDDLGAADVNSVEFEAGIDQNNSEITPPFLAHSMNLKIESGDNVDTVDSTSANISSIGEKLIINQPYATKSRSCTTDFYQYTGMGKLGPSYDGGYSTTQAPAITASVDLARPFVDFASKLNRVIPLQRSTTTTRRSSSSRSSGNQRVTRSTQTRRTTTRRLTVSTGSTATQNVGNYITDIQFRPYIRPRVVRVYVTGLRPNTQHHFFFDGVSVDGHVSPARLTGGWLWSAPRMRPTAARGSVVKSDHNGRLLAIFSIPANKFFVGDRKLQVIDVADLNGQDSASSSAEMTYRGFNVQVQKTQLKLSTRMPIIRAPRTTTQSVSVATTSRSTSTRPRNPDSRSSRDDRRERRRERRSSEGRARRERERRRRDPIAQTFSVEAGESTDVGVIISKLSLFFESKSPTRGVTVELRETENGYPSSSVVPFSQIYLESSQVNTSTRGNVATDVIFETPIMLKTDREYAFVVKPDGDDPDYRIWVAKTGQKDKVNGKPVNQDPNGGVLFTSTNDKAWTPYQDENIKFQLFKGQYDVSGTVYLTNRDTEFLTVENINGEFDGSENVYRINPNYQGSISTDANSTTVTGEGFSQLSAGDLVAYYYDPTNIEVIPVQTVVSDTSMVLAHEPSYTVGSAKFFKTIGGEMVLYDRDYPSRIYLDESNATNGNTTYTNDSGNAQTVPNYFQAGDSLIGEETGATCVITSVDDFKLSYIQPNILMTTTNECSGVVTFDRLTNAGSLVNYVTTPMVAEPGSDFRLTTAPTVIQSRSREVSGSGNKSIRVPVNLSSNTADITPIIDIEGSTMMLYQYLINNDVVDGTRNETQGGVDGPAKAKYVSKPVTLGDGFDADDLNVYLTAYRPAGTDVKIYAKFKHLLDSRNFDSVEWTELTLKPESDGYSSIADETDYKELQFNVSKKVAGDITAGSGAALNTSNNEVIRYVSPDGVLYDNYKTFALKIVMLSSGHNIVPRLKDVRAISLT